MNINVKFFLKNYNVLANESLPDTSAVIAIFNRGGCTRADCVYLVHQARQAIAQHGVEAILEHICNSVCCTDRARAAALLNNYRRYERGGKS